MTHRGVSRKPGETAGNWAHIQPTILKGNKMRVEEIFGPVVALTTFGLLKRLKLQMIPFMV
jgi:acyl-CoA reductase-like NAD-dependent aldehyde dehydrogenase